MLFESVDYLITLQTPSLTFIKNIWLGPRMMFIDLLTSSLNISIRHWVIKNQKPSIWITDDFIEYLCLPSLYIAVMVDTKRLLDLFIHHLLIGNHNNVKIKIIFKNIFVLLLGSKYLRSNISCRNVLEICNSTYPFISLIYFWKKYSLISHLTLPKSL